MITMIRKATILNEGSEDLRREYRWILSSHKYLPKKDAMNGERNKVLQFWYELYQIVSKKVIETGALEECYPKKKIIYSRSLSSFCTGSNQLDGSLGTD